MSDEPEAILLDPSLADRVHDILVGFSDLDRGARLEQHARIHESTKCERPDPERPKHGAPPREPQKIAPRPDVLVGVTTFLLEDFQIGHFRPFCTDLREAAPYIQKRKRCVNRKSRGKPSVMLYLFDIDGTLLL